MTTVNVEQRLRELRIELPAPMSPAGNYVPAVTVGDLVFLSGTGPVIPVEIDAVVQLNDR